MNRLEERLYLFGREARNRCRSCRDYYLPCYLCSKGAWRTLPHTIALTETQRNFGLKW